MTTYRTTKRELRLDMRIVRECLVDMARELKQAQPDWDYVNTLARDIESRGSSIACAAKDNQRLETRA